MRARETEKLARGKGKAAEEDEKGFPLAPSAKDLNPWYSAKRVDPDGEWDDEKRCVFFPILCGVFSAVRIMLGPI